MFENIPIKLNPYLGNSKNLMEFFVIIGYEEQILVEYAQDNNLENDNLYLEMSIISSVTSDLAYGVFDPNIIMKQIYPEKPKIIKITKKEKKPELSAVLFYSCFDSIKGENKILYACYALRFYEKFTILNSSYYIPKAILIFSQYPYFTTFSNISLNIYEQIRNNKINNFNNNIPLEILMYCLVNYVPSPINNSLKLNLFENKKPIIIDKLTAYPYIDFDLSKVYHLMPISMFIKIYILTFLEIGLLFFSPNLIRLNLFMYILHILNYPLIDSNYYWHIKSISKDEIKYGEDTINPTFRGVNAEYNDTLNFQNFKNINFIVDIDNKDIKCINEKKEESKEINKLLKYIHNILEGRKTKSYFLKDYLITLYGKLKKINNEYTKKGAKYPNSFFYIDKDIIETNKKIQEAFYEFVLNILMLLNKDFKLDSNNIKIVNKEYNNPNFSEEENIFLKYYRNAIKYITYFENFICNFKVVDELKVSLIFTDEYVNVKMKDSKKEIPNTIKYFKLIDNFYSLNHREIVINSKDLLEEFNKTYKTRSIKSYVRESENQLFELDKNLIKIFLFHKKSRDLFISLKIKEKEEIKIDSIEKIDILSNIASYFYSFLNQEYSIRSAIIYIFAIVFPFFPKDKSISFLKEIFKNLNYMKLYQRYYIYIILNSIHKYYLINKENNNFPDLTLENIKIYCTLIKDYLIINSIIPNEEIFIFLDKVLSDDKNKIKSIENTKINIDKNNFIFHYENDENFENKIPDNIITRDINLLILNYKSQKIKYELIKSTYLIYQIIYTTYSNYFIRLNFNIVNFVNENIFNSIINIIYILIQYEDKDLACFLLNTLIIFRKLQNYLKLYNINITNEFDNINNENININNNNNVNDINISDNNIYNSIINMNNNSYNNRNDEKQSIIFDKDNINTINDEN